MPRTNTLYLNTENGPFKDASLRAAAREAVDAESIVEGVYEGRADVAEGLLGPALPWAADLRSPLGRATAGDPSGKTITIGTFTDRAELPEVAAALATAAAEGRVRGESSTSASTRTSNPTRSRASSTRSSSPGRPFSTPATRPRTSTATSPPTAPSTSPSSPTPRSTRPWTRPPSPPPGTRAARRSSPPRPPCSPRTRRCRCSTSASSRATRPRSSTRPTTRASGSSSQRTPTSSESRGERVDRPGRVGPPRMSRRRADHRRPAALAVRQGSGADRAARPVRRAGGDRGSPGGDPGGSRPGRGSPCAAGALGLRAAPRRPRHLVGVGHGRAPVRGLRPSGLPRPHGCRVRRGRAAGLRAGRTGARPRAGVGRRGRRGAGLPPRIPARHGRVAGVRGVAGMAADIRLAGPRVPGAARDRPRRSGGRPAGPPGRGGAARRAGRAVGGAVARCRSEPNACRVGRPATRPAAPGPAVRDGDRRPDGRRGGRGDGVRGARHRPYGAGGGQVAGSAAAPGGGAGTVAARAGRRRVDRVHTASATGAGPARRRARAPTCPAGPPHPRRSR